MDTTTLFNQLQQATSDAVNAMNNALSGTIAGNLQQYRRSLKVEAEIPGLADLNTYQTAGNYGCSDSSLVGGLVNKPGNLMKPFLLFVHSVGGSVMQEIIDEKGSRWCRPNTNSYWSQTFESRGIVPADSGGTGRDDLVVNAVLLGNGSNSILQVASKNGALYSTETSGKPKFGTLPIAQGGTGATNAANARANLGITLDNIGIKSWLLNNVFKVGYVWVSYTSTSPASIIGGTWAAITGRFPYFNSGTSQGGSNTHTLTVSELPAHKHWMGLDKDAYYTANSDSGYTVHKNGNESSSGYSTWAWSGSEMGTINGQWINGGGSHNNMPAYQTLYAWRRTA